MKKMLVLATVLAFTAPVFAGDKQDQKEGHKNFNGPRHEMAQNQEFKAQKESRKAEFEARKEQMKAREEKLEKLVKEYKKAKDGSKKQLAAREEIGQILGEMRDEQIAFREKQINGFEQRLGDMKGRLEEEKTADKKTEWVGNMTDRVIEKDGDLKEVMRHGHMGKDGPQFDQKDMKGGMKGPGGKGHFKGGHPGDFRGGPKGPADDILPMPPAPQEEK